MVEGGVNAGGECGARSEGKNIPEITPAKTSVTPLVTVLDEGEARTPREAGLIDPHCVTHKASVADTLLLARGNGECTLLKAIKGRILTRKEPASGTYPVIVSNYNS